MLSSNFTHMYSSRYGRNWVQLFGKNKRQYNANINAQNENGQTALIIAAQKGYNDIVKLLLEKEANALIVDNYQKSTLSYASERGFTEITEMLIPLSF